MKTRLLIILMLLSGFLGQGQTIFLKIGPSFSKLNYKSTTSIISLEKVIIGIDAIAGINYLNFKYFNLSSGIGFIKKGGIEVFETYNGDPSGHEETAILNFLTINTTFNLKIPIKKIIEPYIFVGPRLDYLFYYSNNEYFFKRYVSVNKLNKVIYGVLFGGGINFKVKRFQFGLVFDYYLDINKIVDFTSNYTTDKISDNTFTINALIGFKF